jgi:hypothetical protein
VSGRLVMWVDFDAEPTHVDPQEVAEEVLAVYAEEGRHSPNLARVIQLVNAQWEV